VKAQKRDTLSCLLIVDAIGNILNPKIDGGLSDEQIRKYAAAYGIQSELGIIETRRQLFMVGVLCSILTPKSLVPSIRQYDKAEVMELVLNFMPSQLPRYPTAG